MRDVFEDFIARCLNGEDSVSLDFILDMFENSSHNFEEKETQKLSYLAATDKKIISKYDIMNQEV